MPYPTLLVEQQDIFTLNQKDGATVFVSTVPYFLSFEIRYESNIISIVGIPDNHSEVKDIIQEVFKGIQLDEPYILFCTCSILPHDFNGLIAKFVDTKNVKEQAFLQSLLLSSSLYNDNFAISSTDVILPGRINQIGIDNRFETLRKLLNTQDGIITLSRYDSFGVFMSFNEIHRIDECNGMKLCMKIEEIFNDPNGKLNPKAIIYCNNKRYSVYNPRMEEILKTHNIKYINDLDTKIELEYKQFALF